MRWNDKCKAVERRKTSQSARTSSVSGEEKKKGRRLRCYYALRLRSSSLEPLRTLERHDLFLFLFPLWLLNRFDFDLFLEGSGEGSKNCMWVFVASWDVLFSRLGVGGDLPLYFVYLLAGSSSEVHCMFTSVRFFRLGRRNRFWFFSINPLSFLFLSRYNAISLLPCVIYMVEHKMFDIWWFGKIVIAVARYSIALFHGSSDMLGVSRMSDFGIPATLFLWHV